MEHLVYCDARANELSNLLEGRKDRLIRGAAGRKTPYGRVTPGETVYFIENNGDGMVRARGVVTNVFFSEKMEAEESAAMVRANEERLLLSPAQKKRFEGKKYLCLITVEAVEPIAPFRYNRGNSMDDWVVVETIDELKIK